VQKQLDLAQKRLDLAQKRLAWVRKQLGSVQKLESKLERRPVYPEQKQDSRPVRPLARKLLAAP